MKLGAERNKLMILGGLLGVAALVFFLNRDDTPAQSQAPARAAAPAPAQPKAATPAPAAKAPDISQAPRALRPGGGRGGGEFRPSMKPKRPEDRADINTTDPTLRLDLLAKLQAVKFTGGSRSLFDFSAAPPPKTPDVKIVPKKNAGAAAAMAMIGNPTPAGPPPAPVKPPPPPIVLKFYGYAAQQAKGPRRAFFLDGEEIYIAGEGEIIKKRYKVVRISANSAVVEDLQFSNQQTIRIEEQPS